MKRFTSTLPLLLAAALQILPLVRNIFVNPATGSTIAFILRWGIGTGAALGAVDAVSGATTQFTSPSTFTGEAGSYMSNRVVVAIGGGHKSTSKDYIVLQAGAVTSPLLLNGQSTTVTMPAGLTFTASWVPEGTEIAGHVSGTPALAATNVVKVTIVSPGNASLSQNLTLAIGAPVVPTPPFFVTPPAATNVPLGQTAVFRVTASGSAPLAYRWAKDNVPLANGGNISGATGNVLTIASVGPNDIASYSVTVTNSLGSTNASALLGIVYPPVITSQPTNQSAVVASPVAFGVGVESAAPLRYQWSTSVTKNGKTTIKAIKGATNSVYSLPSATAKNDGGYFVVITNITGAVTSSIATLKVFTPVSLTKQAGGRTVNAGGRTVFSVKFKGTTPIVFQWLKDGLPLVNDGRVSGADSNILVVAALTTNDSGAYTLVASNYAGAVTSAIAQLAVIAPPVIVLAPTNQTAAVSNSVSFGVVVDGTAPFKYQWKKGKIILKGATNATLTIPAVKLTDTATNYMVTIANAAGSVTSEPVALTIVQSAVAAKSVTAKSTVILPQPPVEIGLVANLDGTMTIYFTGVPNANYTLQSCNSLEAPDWQNVGSAPAQPDGSWQMTDTQTAGQPRKVYRVSQP